MNIRQQYQQFEDQFLSPYAVRSKDTKGRMRYLPPCEVRTDFQRNLRTVLKCVPWENMRFVVN